MQWSESIHHANAAEDKKLNCETAHIALICAGRDSASNVKVVIKSIVLHRSIPLHFHFLTNGETSTILNEAFTAWKLSQGNAADYPDPITLPQISLWKLSEREPVEIARQVFIRVVSIKGFRNQSINN